MFWLKYRAQRFVSQHLNNNIHGDGKQNITNVYNNEIASLFAVVYKSCMSADAHTGRVNKIQQQFNLYEVKHSVYIEGMRKIHTLNLDCIQWKMALRRIYERGCVGECLCVFVLGILKWRRGKSKGYVFIQANIVRVFIIWNWMWSL